MKKYLFLLVFGLTFCSASAQKTTLKQFSFLLGNWEKKTSKGMTTESWVNLKDSLKGESYSHNLKGDSILQETVVVKKIEGDFYFCVTGAGNEDRVDFKLVSFKNNILVFENKMHDFPQRIVYQYKGKEELYAYIEGLVGDKETKIEFPYRRKFNN